MQTITLSQVTHQRAANFQHASLRKFFQKVEAVSEANRLGLVAALILVQVSVAGFNVVIPPIVGASVWVMAPGIFMAFLCNSLAFAQVKMRWLLPVFGVGILVNAVISIYSLFLLLTNA